MSKRRLLLAGLAAAALTAVANVLTTARLTPGLGVLVVVELVGGLAIGWAAISQFRLWSSKSALLAGQDLFVRGLSILVIGLLGAFVGAASYEFLGARAAVGNGLHGALVGGAVGLLLSFPMAPLVRRSKEVEDQKEEHLTESVASHEDLVTPVRLPTWNRRFAARALDALLLWVAFRLLDAATGPDTLGGTTDAEAWRSILIVWALYDIVLHPLFGATAGKALCRIRVVDAGGAARVGVLRAAGRWASSTRRCSGPSRSCPLTSCGRSTPGSARSSPCTAAPSSSPRPNGADSGGSRPSSAPQSSPRPSALSARSRLSGEEHCGRLAPRQHPVLVDAGEVVGEPF
jgi:hypothetical protein